MKMPGFSAEASVKPNLGIYRGSAVASNSRMDRVLPMQELLSSEVLSQHLDFGLLGSVWPVIRCCRYAPMLGRWICVSRVHSPLEQCQCLSGAFGPVIICRPPVLQL